MSSSSRASTRPTPRRRTSWKYLPRALRRKHTRKISSSLRCSPHSSRWAWPWAAAPSSCCADVSARVPGNRGSLRIPCPHRRRRRTRRAVQLPRRMPTSRRFRTRRTHRERRCDAAGVIRTGRVERGPPAIGRPYMHSFWISCASIVFGIPGVPTSDPLGSAIHEVGLRLAQFRSCEEVSARTRFCRRRDHGGASPMQHGFEVLVLC
mmetsp:Transcript_3861/g.7952  ORF Transcript_3861/g.7952 Transcript_3861/m.7952 type:complete len:207 (-) Transcript_3861:7-627(-)